MAENIVNPNEMFFTNFEPKQKHRFILYVDGIPSYLVRKVEKPKYESDEVVLKHMNVERYVKGKSRWGEVTLEMYDPILPSGAQIVMEWIRMSHESVTGRDGYADMYKKDITVNELGPIGDKISEWIFKGSWIKASDFDDSDWDSDGESSNITVTIRYDYPILNY